MSAIEETPELHADLPDLLRMVAKLATVKRLGRDFRRLALALADAGADVERMEGLVIEGEAYAATWRQEYAVCRCGDGKHEERRDAPPGRAAWQRTRREADASLATAVARWKWGARSNPEPHLVHHLVSTTTTEKVQ